MHERGMARRLAGEALAVAGDERPTRVTVELTPLAGTSPEAFRMAWEAETAGTPLAGTALVLEVRPARVPCERCGAGHLPGSPHDVLCGSCGAPVAAVVVTDPRLRGVETERDQGSSESTSRRRRSSSS